MTKPGYIGVMKSFASSQASNKWLLLEFSHLGFIGQYFIFGIILTKGYHLGCLLNFL